MLQYKRFVIGSSTSVGNQNIAIQQVIFQQKSALARIVQAPSENNDDYTIATIGKRVQKAIRQTHHFENLNLITLGCKNDGETRQQGQNEKLTLIYAWDSNYLSFDRYSESGWLIDANLYHKFECILENLVLLHQKQMFYGIQYFRPYHIIEVINCKQKQTVSKQTNQQRKRINHNIKFRQYFYGNKQFTHETKQNMPKLRYQFQIQDYQALIAFVKQFKEVRFDALISINQQFLQVIKMIKKILNIIKQQVQHQFFERTNNRLGFIENFVHKTKQKRQFKITENEQKNFHKIIKDVQDDIKKQKYIQCRNKLSYNNSTKLEQITKFLIAKVWEQEFQGIIKVLKERIQQKYPKNILQLKKKQNYLYQQTSQLLKICQQYKDKTLEEQINILTNITNINSSLKQGKSIILEIINRHLQQLKQEFYIILTKLEQKNQIEQETHQVIELIKIKRNEIIDKYSEEKSQLAK